MKRILLCLMTGILCSGVATVEAAFKKAVGGVFVSYSGSGDAYYDSSDGTLTIEIYDSGGSLKVTVGTTAPQFWGDYVDIYLLADNASFKSISIKGTPECTPFVCGQVNYVAKFGLLGGVVGDTDAYGLDFGLGMVANSVPVACSLKYSYTTAQLFGYPNSTSSNLAKTRTLETARAEKRQLIRKIQGDWKAPTAAAR